MKNEGEYWHVKLPGEISLITVVIIEETERTVVIRDIHNGGQQVRYATDDIEWIEKAVN